MKNINLILLLLSTFIFISCKNNIDAQISDNDKWRLGWRMIESSWDEEYELAEIQFDSLLNLADKIEVKFLITGLEVKSKLGKNEEIVNILENQDEESLRQVCQKEFLGNVKPCNGLSAEKVANKILQLEIIRMYVDDQAARGNIMDDIISKFELDRTTITKSQGLNVDEKNRNRLKEIFNEKGFPNRKMIGKDAMHGIFIIIQHADGDREWQKSQLQNIEAAVKNGDMDGQSYAYLYDRIKINNGERQLYGTQFSKVDPINKTVELAETEDYENLDKRRKEIGMMPIEMYKSFMIKNL